MKSTICTLYEGSYSDGVAVLINSAYRRGFRGNLLVGYRGELPLWASQASPVEIKGWRSASKIEPTLGLNVYFLKVTTQSHLTNYKPGFLLELFGLDELGIESIYYFDPDIVVDADWSYFEDWISCGIALCEDVNSPLSIDHPRRIGWRRYYADKGLPLAFRHLEYINAGCIGVQRKDMEFVACWKRCIEYMSDEIGGLNATKVGGGVQLRNKGFANCLDVPDQDALNAAMAAVDATYSIIGREAMAFKPGNNLIPHAIGYRKPWNTNYITEFLAGRTPRKVDKLFWENARGLISPIHVSRIYWNRFMMKLFAVGSRFYSK